MTKTFGKRGLNYSIKGKKISAHGVESLSSAASMGKIESQMWDNVYDDTPECNVRCK